jgi:hypothetical protein
MEFWRAYWDVLTTRTPSEVITFEVIFCYFAGFISAVFACTFGVFGRESDFFVFFGATIFFFFLGTIREALNRMRMVKDAGDHR